MRTAKGTLVSLLLAVALVAGGGCERKQEFDGAGNWLVGTTKRKDFNGVCSAHEDGEIVVCHLFGVKVPLGDHSASATLYFASDAKDAPLIELLLDVPGCRPDELTSWLEEKLGEPDESPENLEIWRGKNTVKLAQAPVAPARCELNFVIESDEERIAQIEKEALAREGSEAVGSPDEGGDVPAESE